MCGRFTLTADGQTLQMALGLDTAPDVKPRYNIAPSQPIGVVTNENPQTLDFFNWGLVPFWADEPKIGYKMINARSETAHEKPSFRAAFEHRRCLIPSDGFYEWQARENQKKKQPMYIFLDEHPVFAFAGLWERWESDDGSEILSCTILTTQANDKIKGVHHRMPVILQRDDYDTWLQADDQAVLRGLMRPYPDEPMAYYPVSTQVNKPANETPDNIVPIEDGGEQQRLF